MTAPDDNGGGGGHDDVMEVSPARLHERTTRQGKTTVNQESPPIEPPQDEDAQHTLLRVCRNDTDTMQRVLDKLRELPAA